MTGPETNRSARNGVEVECPECGETAWRYELYVKDEQVGHVLACGTCGLSRDET